MRTLISALAALTLSAIGCKEAGDPTDSPVAGKQVEESQEQSAQAAASQQEAQTAQQAARAEGEAAHQEAMQAQQRAEAAQQSAAQELEARRTPATTRTPYRTPLAASDEVERMQQKLDRAIETIKDTGGDRYETEDGSRGIEDVDTDEVTRPINPILK